MSKDLYGVLGVSKTASDNEIKSAYKKLALKYHPDRQANKSDKEKKEAEDKFKEVNEAYQVLSDPNKRHQYDTFGTIDGAGQGGGGFDDMAEMFRNFMHGNHGGFGGFGGRQRQGGERGQDVKMNFTISIEEIINGIDREVEFKARTRCKSCGGAGGTGKKTCPHCNGTGMITEVQQMGFSIMQRSYPCNHCHGTGYTIEKECTNCHGDGLVWSNKKVHVKLDPNYITDGAHVSVPQGGYESRDASMPNGDLVLEIIYKFDQTKYAINGGCLYHKIDVPYYDCILGNPGIEVKPPVGSPIKVKIPAGTQTQTKISTGKKLGRLNYVIVVNVKIPTNISGEERDYLEKIRKRK